MQVFDNVNKAVKDDLANTIEKGSKLSIAAACFSIYAYQALKKQLDSIDELRFIFTSPAFVKEKAPKEKREFYIPRLNRERSLYGTEFEIKLRNELTQKAIARECADWIKKKVRFMSNVTNETMGGFLNIATHDNQLTYMPLNGFTTADIGCERGNNSYNMVNRFELPHSDAYVRLFETIWQDKQKLQDVTEEVIDSITAAYNENPADFLYFFILYNIFNEFLEGISEDVLPKDASGFKNSKIWSLLYDFQKNAVLAIINKLEQYNGCILADSVGLGKTFSALAVIKYYENRNRLVLVLCPKKLADNWNTYKGNYKNNLLAEDRLRYDVLYHTDLSRERGESNGLDLEKLNWSNYDLVVIDESHNFRNGGAIIGDDQRENRYSRLLSKVIRPGVKTKVLMLSATPVNTRFNDLKNQLALAYEGQPDLIDSKLTTTKSIDEIFRQAQKVFNQWSKEPPERRTTAELLKALDFDFFKVLDSVTIARSRKHIEKNYNMNAIGHFPERLKPITLHPNLTDLEHAITYNLIYAKLMNLNLSVYVPSDFMLASTIADDSDQPEGITQAGREKGLRQLMGINLLKRLESSVYAFGLTLGRIRKLIDNTIKEIDAFSSGMGSAIIATTELVSVSGFDEDDSNADIFDTARKATINLAEMDYISWRHYLQADADVLELLSLKIQDITPRHDSKLQELLRLITHKIDQPINEGNQKLLIFSAFSDTAEYLYEHVSAYVKKQFGLETALITGSVDGKTTIPRFKATLNNVLTCFSPLSKEKHLLMPDNPVVIDILIGTDCISEGQNLQDCDYCVNYDIHWNPVRIIQRFGRIDRIGSKNSVIQLVNFWPNVTLDDYINLKSRVESRMKISILTAAGDDDPINPEEKGDLEYRKKQLESLLNEVVDIEEMQSGVSIMDLGLNEFRLDLLEYTKKHNNFDGTPYGLHAVVPASAEYPPGVIYVLKNINGQINIDKQNRLHPFYMVYLTHDGKVICDHLSPKPMLDTLRLLCKGRAEPLAELCRSFNLDTKNGKDMQAYSALLDEAIQSIVHVNASNELGSFFDGKPVHFGAHAIKGLDDFELICFLVVR